MIYALFLPALRPLSLSSLSSLAAVEAPNPLVAWSFRWLLFRLMFGFGKLKFMETSKRDQTYIACFIVNQPMTSLVGWFAAKMPLIVFRVALLFMFIVEVCAQQQQTV